MIGPNVQCHYNKGTYTYFQHYCIMSAFVVCHPTPFSSVMVFWWVCLLPWCTRGFIVDCTWGLLSLPWKKVGTEKFQFRKEVKLRNVMFSIRPASTIGVRECWHSLVIQDSVGSSIVDVRKTASNASFIFCPCQVGV